MKWEQIQGFSGWSQALHVLIDEATRAFTNRNHDEKNVALSNLRDFIAYSPDETAASLDDLALKTIAGMVAKGWDEGVAEMYARSAELAKLTKLINAITTAGNQGADSIRLTRIRSVVDQATESIQAMTLLKAQLEAELAAIEEEESSELKGAIAKIELAIKAAQSMRTVVEGLS